MAYILHTARIESIYALSFSLAKETLEFNGKEFSPQINYHDRRQGLRAKFIKNRISKIELITLYEKFEYNQHP